MLAHVLGTGIYGPGFDGWSNSVSVLRGAARYCGGALPALHETLLPATERRRAAHTVQLAVRVAQEATERAGVAPDSVPTVFASSGGDLETAHELCVALAQPQKVVSPTRFHNSVHNAAAGCWGIAAGARTPSISLSCFDETFAAGLLEALCQVQTGANTVLLVVYDYPAPVPLHDKRPLAVPFGIALLLSANSTTTAQGKLQLRLEPAQPETSFADPQLEELRCGVPAARALPLLHAFAGNRTESVIIAYLGACLKVDVQPCR